MDRSRVGVRGFLVSGGFSCFLSFLMVVGWVRPSYYDYYELKMFDFPVLTRFIAGLWVASFFAALFFFYAFMFRGGGLPSRVILFSHLVLLPSAGMVTVKGFTGVAYMLALLVSIFTLLLIFISDGMLLPFERREAFHELSAVLLASMLAVELPALFFRVYAALTAHGSPLHGLVGNVVFFETGFANIAYMASPLMLGVLVFSWLWMIFATGLSPGRWGGWVSTGKAGEMGVPMLLGSMLLGVFLVCYPYFYVDYPVGFDAEWYVERLDRLGFEGVGWLIGEARAPYLLLLYGLRLVCGLSSIDAVKVGPVFPTILLACGSYLLVKVGLGDGFWAGFAALLAPLTVHTTVGLYAGIYTNWLALGEVCLFSALMVEAVRKSSTRRLYASMTLSLLVLFTHAWTWGVLMAAVAVFSVVEWVRVVKTRIGGRSYVYPFMVLGFNVAAVTVAVAATWLLGLGLGAAHGVGSGLYQVVGSMSVWYLRVLPSTLVRTLIYYAGGFFSSPLILFFTLLGALTTVFRGRDVSARFMLSWLAVGTLGAALLDSWYQWRLLYLIPYPALMACGLRFMVESLFRGDRRLGSWLGLGYLLAAWALSSAFNYALHSLYRLSTA